MQNRLLLQLLVAVYIFFKSSRKTKNILFKTFDRRKNLAFSHYYKYTGNIIRGYLTEISFTIYRVFLSIVMILFCLILLREYFFLVLHRKSFWELFNKMFPKYEYIPNILEYLSFTWLLLRKYCARDISTTWQNWYFLKHDHIFLNLFKTF